MSRPGAMNAPGMCEIMMTMVTIVMVVERKVMAEERGVEAAPGTTEGTTKPPPWPPGERIIGPGIIRPGIAIIINVIRIAVCIHWRTIRVRRGNGGLRALSIRGRRRGRRRRSRGGCRRLLGCRRAAMHGLGAHFSAAHQHGGEDFVGNTMLLEGNDLARAGVIRRR